MQFYFTNAVTKYRFTSISCIILLNRSDIFVLIKHNTDVFK